MLHKLLKKSSALILVACFIISILPSGLLSVSAEKAYNRVAPEEGSYGAYIAEHSGADLSDDVIVINAAEFKEQIGAQASVCDYNGRSDVLHWDSMEGSIIWEVDVPSSGLYEISIEYCPAEGKGSYIDLGVMIDGQYPFVEAQMNNFCRIWKDESGMKMDDQGNEYTPSVSETPRWLKDSFSDVNGYYSNDAYLFFFEAGVHTVTLVCNNEAFALSSIELSNGKEVKSYKDTLAEWKSKGYKDADIKTEFIQAETPYEKSDQTLRAQYDRNSPLTQPFDPTHIRYNCIGGNSWKYQSQWISWELDVPIDGFYKLGARYRQETIKGFASSRRLTIDGELPFAEADCINFAYTEDWDMHIFGEENEPYLFYLTKGKHIMTLEVVMGDISVVVDGLQQTAENLMELYRKIVMITGTSPDPYRDYSIDESISDMTSILTEARRVLKAEKENLITITGNKAINTTTIQTLLSQVESVIKEPDSIVEGSRLGTFSSNISGLSSWLLDLKYQPLTIDYFALMAPDAESPRVKANFFENFISGFKNFISSFVQDYSTAGDKASKDTITIWLTVGRDQMQILKNMVSDMFTPESGVHVDIKLVSASLVQAVLANNGPDVAVMTARTEPVDLAIRNALVDISKLDGFEDIKKRFIDTAFVPYTFGDGCYGIPDSLVYQMMFYRTDVFEQLGLKCPQTWDELLEIAPILQRNSMKIGLPSGAASSEIFPAILMQKGESIYTDDRKDTNFSSSTAYDAFLQWTDYYKLHGFSLEYNFYSLFRTGEMPLGIAPYNMFNTIKVAAPEIDGLWDMVQIPGTVKDLGIDRTVGASGTASIIFKNTKKVDAAWEFIKWWTSDEAQTRYALDMESIMGVSARQTPANIKTMESLGWSKRQLSALRAQMDCICEVPEVPGSYYVTRNLANAFNATVVSGENARESLIKWSKETTIELERKRKEFGLE